MKKLEKIKKIKENKVVKFIYNFIYTILVILALLVLAVVIMQRVSNNNLSLGNYRIFNIISQSMIPKYDIGDVLVSKKIDPSKIKMGDDVVYKGEEGSFKDKIVTHQVIATYQENGKYKFSTKGIANDQVDPMITEDQVYGVIVYKIKTLSLISKMTTNLYVFYFIIFVPVVILIFVEIKKIIFPKDDDEEDEEETENENKKNE